MSVIQQRLNIQDENSNINSNKAMVSEKSKSSKQPLGKGGAGLGSRKALKDITNKPIIHQEASTRQKNSTKDQFNISEEKFLHDHGKCIEAQKAIAEPLFLDIVLPGHDSVLSEFSVPDPAKTELDSPCCYPEPIELSMSEFSDWLQFSPPLDSPISSPIHWDSPPSSSQAWKFEPVEFVLKQESDN